MPTSLTHDDVQRLLKVLDSSQFDELHLEADGVKLTLRRNGASGLAQVAPPASPAAIAAPQASAATHAARRPAAAVDAGLLEIRAPMLGTFYSAPKPGAEPFVSVGGRIDRHTPVAIIEVMKLMNSIPAGVEGVVVDVLARDGELVEFDQVLMRVRPA